MSSSSSSDVEPDWRLIGAIRCHDMSWLEHRCKMNLGWSRSKATKVMIEYKRFLTLKVMCEKDGNVVLAPPPTIEAAWTLHLLDNGDCQKLYDAAGTIILHDPDDETLQQSHIIATLCAYRSRFEHDEPKDIWDFPKCEPPLKKRRVSGGFPSKVSL